METIQKDKNKIGVSQAKTGSWCSALVVGLFFAASVGTGRANVVINTFDSAAEVSAYSFNSWQGSSAGSAIFSTNDANGNAASGSMEIQLAFDGDGQDGGSFISSAAPVDVSEATYVEFDLMVDPASPVDPNGNVFYFQMGFNSSSTIDVVQFWLGPWGNSFTPGVWQHFKVAVSPGELGTSESDFFIDPYDNDYTSAATPIVYIDNIVFDTPPTNAPGPAVSLSKPTQGLNLFASTAGLYDRESARLVQSAGESWVGQATADNPVTYSFTINGFPTAPTYSCEAYLFLIPNPTANDNAPDYDESDCVYAEVQAASSGSLLSLAYKVNETDGNDMFYGAAPYTNAPGSWDGVTSPWYESGALGSLSSTLLNGTYSLQFTSSSNVTLIAPDGSSTNLVIPSYNAGDFAGTSGFNVYLGMQPNTADAFGQAVVYSSFAIAGTASPYSENFLTDAALNTNIWDTSVASAPVGVLIVPASAAYWVKWTAPAAGYGLQTGSNLLNIASWTSPTIYPVLNFSGGIQQLVDSSELPAGGTGFFNLIKRSFSQLQVLLPGETNAPGTATGKIGTPDLASVGVPVTLTINAVDSSWHIINGVTDTINISSSGGAYLPDPTPLANGTLQESIVFSSSGSFTVTATDGSNTNITSNTSSTITVQ